jgi:hypothetical protein
MKSLTVIETNDLAEILRSIVRQELDARERPNEIMTKQQLCDYTGWSISKSKVDEWLTKEQSYL